MDGLFFEFEAIRRLRKLDRAEPSTRGKAHDDERMMQFMFTNRPLEKVPCQLAEEFKVRLKTALTRRPFSEGFRTSTW